MDASTQSLLMSSAVVAMVAGIFNGVAPSISDVSASPADDATIAKNTRTAAWLAAGFVGGVAVLAKDPTVFTLGAATTVAYAWWLRSANHSHPGKANGRPAGTVSVEKPAAPATASPVTTYDAAYAGF